MKRFATYEHYRVGMGMDHQQAVANEAVERYILDELTPEERLDFERHFFTCPECAEAVEAATVFAANTREIAHSEKSEKKVKEIKPQAARPQWRLWLNPLPAIAAVVLLGLAGFQNLVVIPALKNTAAEWSHPRAISSVLIRPLSRGAGDRGSATKWGNGALILKIQLDSKDFAPEYEVGIKDPSGAVIAAFTANRAVDGTLEIAWPSSHMEAGEYTILVRPSSFNAAQAKEYPFRFEK
jgi:hypothetical protein